MNNKRLITKLFAIVVSILLASCGGGGYYGDNSSSSSNGGTTTTSSVNISAISLKNSSGNSESQITSQGVTAQVTVKDASGNGISGAIVTFSGTNMTFGTTNGTALTNADGVATISIVPTDSSISGAYVLSATASYNNVTSTATTLNVTFSKQNIVIANMVAASTNLVSGGSTLVSLVTEDASTGATQNNAAITFTTSCGSFSNSSVTSSSQGAVDTTYYAYDSTGKLCDGTQTITATTSTGTAQSITVSIASAPATSIVYTTTKDVQLGIQLSGTSSSEQIEFTVYSNGTALKNANVTLSLEKAPSDFSFISLNNRTTQTVKSDSSGKVIVNLYPGNIPGPVEIKATLANGLSALSKNITVVIGRATQASFSLSVSKNSLQDDIDGDTATITARLADRTGNTVPDGTIVSFVTEGGKIDGFCKTADGVCSVTLRTQNPRPANGRVTVLAYVEGDKSYIDVDGDNVYTPKSAGGKDTLISNIGSFFRDDNENNIYDSNNGEFLYKRVNTSYSTDTCAASFFNQPNIPFTCNDELATTLRQQIILYFASDTATVSNSTASGTSLSFNLYGNSMGTTPMPSGTVVAVTAIDNTANSATCSAELLSGSTPVANVVKSTFYEYQLTGCAVGDSFKIKTTAPNDKISSVTVYYQ